MAGDKDQLARRGALGAPLEIVFGIDRLAIFIDAEDGHVEVVTRIGEVIRVTAEEGGLLFGGKDNAYVAVGLVSVEPVLAALVEGDHVGAQAALVLALFLDGCNLGV